MDREVPGFSDDVTDLKLSGVVAHVPGAYPVCSTLKLYALVFALVLLVVLDFLESRANA